MQQRGQGSPCQNQCNKVVRDNTFEERFIHGIDISAPCHKSTAWVEYRLQNISLNIPFSWNTPIKIHIYSITLPELN